MNKERINNKHRIKELEALYEIRNNTAINRLKLIRQEVDKNTALENTIKLLMHHKELLTKEVEELQAENAQLKEENQRLKIKVLC